MFNFLRVGKVQLFKLFYHSIILTITLTFLFLLAMDLISLALGFRIEINISYVSVIVVIWVLYALKSERYKKENNI